MSQYSYEMVLISCETLNVYKYAGASQTIFESSWNSIWQVVAIQSILR